MILENQNIKIKESDPLISGLDLRLESTDAVFGLHQGVSVDTWAWRSPSNTYLKTGEFAISFASNGGIDTFLGIFGVGDTGHVYKDWANTAKVIETKVTTPMQDQKILGAFEALTANGGKKDQYSIYTNSCRDFSQNTFNSY